MNFTLNGRILKYVNEECILIYFRNLYWKDIKSFVINSNYKVINIGNKKYLLHRIIAYLFLGLDIEDEKQIIDHIDGNKQNNKIENLRIVTQQQNCFNKKGNGFYKIRNKFCSRIRLDYELIYLGLFETEEEARQAYLDAKQKFHVIE